MKCRVCKKNISQSTLTCPHCKARTGIMCNHCKTINPVGTLVCSNCKQELLKVCSRCKSVNFPNATKCRKCGVSFGVSSLIQEKNDVQNSSLLYSPKLLNRNQAVETLIDVLQDKNKKIISVTGEKGIGKSSLLSKVQNKLVDKNFQWCLGKCTPLTQLTPGGVVQDMLLNLFKLPNFYITNNDLKRDAVKFFSNEFKFLNSSEISDFLNFLYNSKDGEYEDIIINKKRTTALLSKIFDAFVQSGKFIFVIDNFDFIDGFSLEFFTKLIRNNQNWKSFKLILLYNEHKPVGKFFELDDNENVFADINLALSTNCEIELDLKLTGEYGVYVTPREKEVILDKAMGNPAFVEQAINYCFDCQISDKAFLMPNDFSTLIKERLETLKKSNIQAYKMLCCAAILGDRLNLALLKEVFGYKTAEFNDIMAYLVKSNFVRPYNEIFYEFNNLLLWENVLKNIQKDLFFEDINIKIGRALSVFNLNTNATMAMIAHNLKENRMAFDIWTKNTRLAAYIGDINLYVISQRQCLALLNEFNENETLNIRYNISERLGKLLTEYDPEEAIEFLPDAISNARANNNEEKEIELLGYLALCCKKIGNYFGDIECVDNVLKKLTPSQELQAAMVKASKLSSLISIGNCGEVINLIDNEIIPKVSSQLTNPRLSETIPMSYLYDTWLTSQVNLAIALAFQGNDRSFEILTNIFSTIEKHKLTDEHLIARAKLTLAFANTAKGNYKTSQQILADIASHFGLDQQEPENINDTIAEVINIYNLINIINMIMNRTHEKLHETLFIAAKFANDTGNEYMKNIFKTLLGKLFCDSNQAQKALEIYNEQVTYFANKKYALGALLTWYLISEATIVAESPNKAIEIASQALEIAQNPKINNYFFIILLKSVLANAYMQISDYESAKINIETALTLTKKYNMNDLTSKLYLLYGKCYQEIGSVQSQNQSEYLKGAIKMFDKALDIVSKQTQNQYMKDVVTKQKSVLLAYCSANGLDI